MGMPAGVADAASDTDAYSGTQRLTGSLAGALARSPPLDAPTLHRYLIVTSW
jgi:hypothetical protein